MSWNYRVVKRAEGHKTLFDVREVYYNADGSIKGYCAASVEDWESEDSLRATLMMMLEAFDQPVLESVAAVSPPQKPIRESRDHD